MAGDDVKLPRFEDWRQGFGGGVGLWDYASRKGGVTLAIAFARLFWPELIEVEDCVLLKERYDPTAFEQWRAQLGDQHEAIERTVNHVHLWDLFDPASEGVPEEGLDSLAAIIAETWRCALARQFPGRSGAVLLERDGEVTGRRSLCSHRRVEPASSPTNAREASCCSSSSRAVRGGRRKRGVALRTRPPDDRWQAAARRS
jgi:hypothetical protein